MWELLINRTLATNETFCKISISFGSQTRVVFMVDWPYNFTNALGHNNSTLILNFFTHIRFFLLISLHFILCDFTLINPVVVIENKARKFEFQK